MVTLFTVVGAGKYEPMVYTLKGKKSLEVLYAPIALLELLDLSEKVDVVVFLTDEAQREHGEALRKEVEGRGHEFKPVQIPKGSTEDEIWEIFKTASQQLAVKGSLVLDITHGLRSIQFLLLGAVVFLKEIKGVDLKSVYYGAYEVRNKTDGTEPIFDLTPLVDMIEWAHAVRTFSKYGHAGDIGVLLANLQDAAHRRRISGETARLLKTLGARLEDISKSLAQGLPLELGFTANRLTNLDQSKLEEELDRFAFPAKLILPTLMSSYRKFAIEQVRDRGQWKKELILDERELERQAKVVNWYLDRNQTDMALRMVREWMVNRAILAMSLKEKWLDYDKARKFAETKLNVLANTRRSGYKSLLRAEQSRLAEWWARVATERNAVAHCGFLEKEVKATKKLKGLWGEISSSRKSDRIWDLGRSAEKGVVLLTPLGLSKGLLYSALKLVEPNEVIVVTSRDAEAAWEEVLERAKFPACSARKVVMEDPYFGFKEAESIKTDLMPFLLQAERVVANQTGGTTVMQLVIQRICREVHKFDVPIEEIALVDRRPMEEQRRNPYVLGERLSLGWAGF